MVLSQAVPLVVGLTGSIGSGKSEVAAILQKLGAAIVDADVLARDVVKPGTLGLKRIVKEFGPTVLNPDSTLNRRELGSLVFNDPGKRKKLEKITHPLIRELWLSQLEELKQSGSHKIIVYVVPLLFESKNRYPELEKIIVVAASESTCLSRIKSRDNLKEEEALLRIRAQLNISEKIKKAHFVVMNEGDRKALESQVLEIYSELYALERE